MSRNRVLFRLRSSADSSSVEIQGSAAKGRELREAIAAVLKIPEQEISITLNGDEVGPDRSVDAFSEVLVERRASKLYGKPTSAYAKEKMLRASKVEEYIGTASTPAGVATAPSASPNGVDAEAAHIAGLMAEATKHSGDMRFANPAQRGPRGPREGGRAPPGPTYVCHNCRKRGHYIEDCPEERNRDRGKALSTPIGIAESKLERVDPSALDGNTAGRQMMITRTGQLVVRKKEPGAFGGVDRPSTWSAACGPEAGDPQCAICKALPRDAVRFPCCSAVACSTCWDEVLASGSDEGPRCPQCGAAVCFDDVLPAEDVREVVATRHRKRPRGDGA